MPKSVRQTLTTVSMTIFLYANLKEKKILTMLAIYRKVASSNMSRLEAHKGFFRLLMKGILDPYVL